MTHIAKVFRSGNPQAVRLPKSFRLDAEEVEISREGDAFVLRPSRRSKPAWTSLPELAAKGTPIGPYDTLIAGQAKTRDMIFVTNDVGEFSRVSGLRFQDWTIE